jgi:hypothetical protein
MMKDWERKAIEDEVRAHGDVRPPRIVFPGDHP